MLGMSRGFDPDIVVWLWSRPKFEAKVWEIECRKWWWLDSKYEIKFSTSTAPSYAYTERELCGTCPTQTHPQAFSARLRNSGCSCTRWALEGCSDDSVRTPDRCSTSAVACRINHLHERERSRTKEWEQTLFNVQCWWERRRKKENR